MSKQLIQQVIDYLSPALGGAVLLHTPDIQSVASLETVAGAYYITIEKMKKNPDPDSYQVEVSLFVPASDFFDFEGDLLPYSYLIQNRTADYNRIKVGTKVYMHQVISMRVANDSEAMKHRQTRIKVNGHNRNIIKKGE